MRWWMLGVGLGWASTASAFAFRVAQVPNGPEFGCALCHVSPLGGGPRTRFGEDMRPRVVGVNVDWPAVCPLDSDQDGFSNGTELGDADCTWRRGEMPDGPATNPNDPNDFPMPEPDAGPPDVGVPDLGPLDGGQPDGGLPDGDLSDGDLPDGGQPDLGLPDVGLPDMTPDGTPPDRGAGGGIDQGAGGTGGSGGGGCQSAPGGGSAALGLLGLLVAVRRRARRG